MTETLNDVLPIGTIVRSDKLHGVPFGTIKDVRPNHRTGHGWGKLEYRVDRDVGRSRSQTWIDENQVEVTDLDWVLGYFAAEEDDLRKTIRQVSALIGHKVPKYNPEKHLGGTDGLSDAYRHADGSLTYITHDEHPDTESPRSDDGNVSTLIQTNSRCISIDDDDDAYLGEARDRFGSLALMRRYLRMFRPDILHYDDHWGAGDSYGWGYVTRENWVKWMGEDYAGPITPEEAFDSEVKVYGQWADNEIYAVHRVEKRGATPETVCGHYGYDSHEAMAQQYTDSPIIDTLY